VIGLGAWFAQIADLSFQTLNGKLGSFCKKAPFSRPSPVSRRRAGAASVRGFRSDDRKQVLQLLRRGGGEVQLCEHLVADLADPHQVQQSLGSFVRLLVVIVQWCNLQDQDIDCRLGRCIRAAALPTA
jgi:hypothetical protein